MEPFDADVGIVGAGPAGARAAELLAEQEAEVLLWDPKAPWEKPCGGGLPSSAFENVPELREMTPRARKVGSIRVEVTPKTGFTIPLSHPMYMVSRRDLACWQLERTRRLGVEPSPATIRSIERWKGGWRLGDAGGGTWSVGFLVGADGAASAVRRAVSPEFRIELAPTRVAYPQGPGSTPTMVVVKLYDEVEGYLWDFPRIDHRSIGIGLHPGSWNRARMDGEVDGYRFSRKLCDCESPARAGAVIGTAQLGHGDYSGVGANDFALLGDAAGFADPATGEGIENALRSAQLLADAYRADGDFRSYPSRARAAFEREFRVARRVRRVLFESGLGTRLIRKGMEADWAYALAAGVANATNEHDSGTLRLLRRWWDWYRHVGRSPAIAHRQARPPVPCECGSPECRSTHGDVRHG